MVVLCVCRVTAVEQFDLSDLSFVALFCMCNVVNCVHFAFVAGVLSPTSCPPDKYCAGQEVGNSTPD